MQISENDGYRKCAETPPEPSEDVGDATQSKAKLLRKHAVAVANFFIFFKFWVAK